MSAGVHGVREVIAALERVAVEAEAAARRIVVRGQALLEAGVKAEFTTSHAKGTPTPSAPGEPPAVVSGTLRRGIRSDMPRPIGGGAVRGRVLPTAIYARIQEEGGSTWNGGFLPPRPFVKPAHEKAKDRLQAIAVEEWRRIR